MNVMDWLKKNASTILTYIGAAGVVGTAVLAAKEAPKAVERKKVIEKEKGEPLTVGESILAIAPSYIPAFMVGTGTIVCIFAANALNQRQQAMLLSAYAALESSYQEYRSKVDAICGEGTTAFIDKAIEQDHADKDDDNPPWDREQTFYIDGLSEPRFFDRTMEQVMQAEYNLNRLFILRGQVTLNDFLNFLDIDSVMEGDRLGWEEYIGETQYGYRWIDFRHKHYLTDDGLLVCSIEMPFAPHSLMEEDYDWHQNHLQRIADEQRQQF